MDVKQMHHEKCKKASLFQDALPTAQLFHPTPLLPAAIEAMMLVCA